MMARNAASTRLLAMRMPTGAIWRKPVGRVREDMDSVRLSRRDGSPSAESSRGSLRFTQLLTRDGQGCKPDVVGLGGFC